jgi:hypothetical protein
MTESIIALKIISQDWQWNGELLGHSPMHKWPRQSQSWLIIYKGILDHVILDPIESKGTFSHSKFYLKIIRICFSSLKMIVRRPIVFMEWRDTMTFSNLKSTHCTLLILLIINLVTTKSMCIVSIIALKIISQDWQWRSHCQSWLIIFKIIMYPVIVDLGL